MWNSGFESYGGSTFGGAGGYTQSPGGFGSPTPSQAERKSRARAQHIVPCTISQLLSATLVDEVFRIGSVEISQVTIVGIIRHAEKAPTNIVYKIDDMTAAPMDVRQWVDTDDASGENTVVPPETYVKVAGHLRSFQNKKSLVAFKIMPLEDMNEFTAHILEVVNAHMMLTKANSQPPAGRAPISNPGMGEAGSFGGNSLGPTNGLTVAQNQVLNLIKACPRPEGLNFHDLKNQLQHMPIASIKQAVDFLSNEGHIYSTVDDDHFKSTDAE
ncbi:replication protein A 32 kDa subunit isoform X1 [Eptesicus fuscus]|uniref:replication protein A 32 kDa subunit isoform X1 n=2 Tax=Eptesicus fuscus TaxID=29078 RepID=UPI00046BA940|nr:replication protein A 32 kDa subunit isoform X1 [Eptesicus fuscus]XP_054577173.1 replication protein A 32 kDa subunit isoform X1 [Eptesicus fuscus]